MKRLAKSGPRVSVSRGLCRVGCREANAAVRQHYARAASGLSTPDFRSSYVIRDLHRHSQVWLFSTTSQEVPQVLRALVALEGETSVQELRPTRPREKSGAIFIRISNLEFLDVRPPDDRWVTLRQRLSPTPRAVRVNGRFVGIS